MLSHEQNLQVCSKASSEDRKSIKYEFNISFIASFIRSLFRSSVFRLIHSTCIQLEHLLYWKVQEGLPCKVFCVPGCWVEHLGSPSRAFSSARRQYVFLHDILKTVKADYSGVLKAQRQNLHNVTSASFSWSKQVTQSIKVLRER